MCDDDGDGVPVVTMIVIVLKIMTMIIVMIIIMVIVMMMMIVMMTIIVNLFQHDYPAHHHISSARLTGFPRMVTALSTSMV